MPNLRRRVLAPAQQTGGAVPYVQVMPYVAGGAAFVEGEILTPDASDPGNFEAYTTTPLISTATGVVEAVALQDKDSNPGFEMGQDSQVIATTGRSAKASSVVPNRNTLLSVAITNAGVMTTAALLQVLVKNAYDLVRNTINNTPGWQLDANVDGTVPATGSFVVERIVETIGPNGELWAVGTFVEAVLAAPAA